MLQRLGQHKGHSSESGLSRIELLVVLVILGALLCGAALASAGLPDKAEDAAKRADRSLLHRAQQRFQAESAVAAYGTESDLVDTAVLQVPSKLHDICLRSDHQAYFLVASGHGCRALPAGHDGDYSTAP